MNASLLVAGREYAENARTKGFWIGLLLFPLLLTAGIKVPVLLEKKGTPTRYFAVVDRSAELLPIVDAAVEAAHQRRVSTEKLAWMSAHQGAPKGTVPAFEPPRRRFVRVELPPDVDTSPGELVASARPYLVGDRETTIEGESRSLFALVVLPEDLGARGGAEFWCKNLADDDLRQLIEEALAQELRRREYVDKGMDEGEIARIAKIDAPLVTKDPTKEEGEETVSDVDQVRQWAPVGFVYILFAGIFTVSQMLLNSTLEEKSNRIVEVLFSSITAWELMLGKLLGIAGIGLTMMAAWFGTGYFVVVYVGGLDREIVDLVLGLMFAPGMLVPFVAYFALGYLLYAGIFLAIGSMCNTIKETQNFMAPVMLLSMVPLFTMMFIPKDPNGTLATILSWVPLWTPFVMMNRAAANPPTVDLVGTGILLVASVVVVIWLSGRIFRTAILRTGQPPRLLELLRWVRG